MTRWEYRALTVPLWLTSDDADVPGAYAAAVQAQLEQVAALGWQPVDALDFADAAAAGRIATYRGDRAAGEPREVYESVTVPLRRPAPAASAPDPAGEPRPSAPSSGTRMVLPSVPPAQAGTSPRQPTAPPPAAAPAREVSYAVAEQPPGVGAAAPPPMTSAAGRARPQVRWLGLGFLALAPLAVGGLLFLYAVVSMGNVSRAITAKDALPSGAAVSAPAQPGRPLISAATAQSSFAAIPSVGLSRPSRAFPPAVTRSFMATCIPASPTGRASCECFWNKIQNAYTPEELARVASNNVFGAEMPPELRLFATSCGWQPPK